MERRLPILIRKEEVRAKRVTFWRLVCSVCGPIEPPVRSKIMLPQVAEEHGEKLHPRDHVSLLP